MHSGPGANHVMTPSLLLASASPRRRQIIAMLGLPFTFCVSPADEDTAAGRYRGPGEGLAPWLAKHKLASVLNLPEAADRMVIAADTTVLMRRYSDEEIAFYIASGDPMDKAGAYGIQHPGFQPTARINGCYLNVVGLPLCILVDLMAEFNVWPVLRGQDREGCPWSEQCLV